MQVLLFLSLCGGEFSGFFDTFTQRRMRVEHEDHPLLGVDLAKVLVGQAGKRGCEGFMLASGSQGVIICHVLTPTRQGIFKRLGQQAIRTEDEGKRGEGGDVCGGGEGEKGHSGV